MNTEQLTIPLTNYRFFFETDDKPHLPAYPGSTWRGAFGHSLKKTVCVVRNTPCNQCILKTACAYSYIFETPPPANSEKMRKYTSAPHPFVFRFHEMKVVAESTYTLDIILFGHGQRYFPYIVNALQKAGQDGIGSQQQIFNLQKIDDISQPGQSDTIYQNGELKPQQPTILQAPPKMPEQIEITFHSPLRIKQDSKNLTARDFNFGAFFGILLRRVSMISYFHTDTPLETDFAALTVKARTVQFSSQQLKWYDWTRYSSRQQTEMNMGGLIGRVHLDMQDLEEFWPYLWLGQWTHVGKGTSMGLGAYSIQSTSLPTA
jgi:CRISPR/Cas system endoribonuclease Cas6 (RAMP superfamily)